MLHKKTTSHQGPDKEASRTIFLGGIPLVSTPDLLRRYLSTFDRVEHLDMPRYPDSGILKGYAKAVLASREGVDRVVSQNPHPIGGLEVGILRWQNPQSYLNRKNQENKRKVYVRISHDLDQDTLFHHFSRIAEVEEVSIKTQPITNQRRNFCYILFKTREGASEAIRLNPHLVNHTALVCEPSIRPDQASKHSNIEKRVKKGILAKAVQDLASMYKVGSKPSSLIEKRKFERSDDLIQDPVNKQREETHPLRFADSMANTTPAPRRVAQGQELGLPRQEMVDARRQHLKPTSVGYSAISLSNMKKRHHDVNVRFNVTFKQ